MRGARPPIGGLDLRDVRGHVHHLLALQPCDRGVQADDLGQMINPGIDRGQITGAFVQGMGWLTTEELRYAPDGELLSHSPTTYKIPNIQDLPATFNVNCIDNDTNTINIRGSKAVGEPPLLLGISVWCAVKNALAYESHGAIPQLRAPATGEEILRLLTEYKNARVGVEDGDVVAAG